MKIKLVIPRLPESYNRIVKFSGWEREEYQNDWYTEVKAAWLIQRSSLGDFTKSLPFKKATVIFTFFFPDKRIRDHVNMAGGAKYALDALVHFKIIQSDQWYPERFVNDLYAAAYDKLQPRTEILIAEEESVSQAIERMLAEALRNPTTAPSTQEAILRSGINGIPGQITEVEKTK